MSISEHKHVSEVELAPTRRFEVFTGAGRSEDVEHRSEGRGRLLVSDAARGRGPSPRRSGR